MTYSFVKEIHIKSRLSFLLRDNSYYFWSIYEDNNINTFNHIQAMLPKNKSDISGSRDRNSITMS